MEEGRGSDEGACQMSSLLLATAPAAEARDNDTEREQSY
jgi:hypothetical protein